MGEVRLWLLMLCVPPFMAAPESFVVQVKNAESVQRGHTATLQCWLSPPQSAEALEVRWYRGDERFDTPALFYDGRTQQVESQDAPYFDRVSFGTKDAASGGLRTGDVSLKLDNVTVEDAGEYTCYVSSAQAYDSATVRLHLIETGSTPRLSVAWTGDDAVNVSCGSEGWYPRPALHWSNQAEDLSPKVLSHRQTSTGLYAVHSWLLVPGDSQVSCAVGLQNEEAKEARINLKSSTKQRQNESGDSGNGWLAFGLLFAAVAVAFALLALMYIRRRSRKSQNKSVSAAEREPLIVKGAVKPTPLSKCSDKYVNVDLVENKNEFLSVRGTILRDNKDKCPDGTEVTCQTAIRGSPGFSEGQHYWEVSVAMPNIDPKTSWWIGVTSAAENPLVQRASPNTSNGFWFLSSTSDHLQLSTEPSIKLSTHQRPRTIGVYLNYDSGELSFYDVDVGSLIVSFTAAFEGQVFPLFNPGKGETSSMKILHRDAEAPRDAVVEVEQTNSTSQDGVPPPSDAATVPAASPEST